MKNKTEKEYFGEPEQTKPKYKLISIRVPTELLNQMGKVRENEGISVSYQLCKGAELYLEQKASKTKK